jgi:predicted RNA polymerase sigma factor
LLFNEGYHGASADATVRTELCGEARRLVMLLVEHPATRSGWPEHARVHFQAALTLARNPMERRFFEQRLSECALRPSERGAPEPPPSP